MKPLQITSKSPPPFDQFIGNLVDCGYERVDMVLGSGEFSVRGGILDVFAPNWEQGVRIEYWGSQIDRITQFDIATQRATNPIDGFEIPRISERSPFKFTTTPTRTVLTSDIQEGDYIVHERFGVGRFEGLVHLTIGGREGEYLYIQYKGSDKLYVPIEHFTFLHRYSGGDLHPKIHGLHDGTWLATLSKVRRATITLAEDVYRLYQARNTATGHAFNDDTVWQIEMESAFPHTPTPDQTRVSNEIKADMESAKPMDRLVCGDVGYGKTELLIRAAFKAIENHKQVALLAPTTLLAHQHFQSFSARFAPFGAVVALLSRFNSKAENAITLSRLKTHHIDMIIGTHRLLQKDVAFADLGLLIIDEEQRFGVAQKEKIKQLKTEVDVLSVSATPIPRTLYMALTGGRDLSTIETPPQNRKPIQTVVSPMDPKLLKTAITAEIDRGGQVFYIHNEVRTIHQKEAKLAQLFPKLKISVAHGQMPETTLQTAIANFVDGKTDLLLCSTIVENGLDLPNVNTIIIDHAENFGLSQIHQLRGRVGRSERQAYAYLFFPTDKILTTKSRQRLDAIREYAALGSGYHLAMKDLEIRGAGTLLGHAQHGNMTSIGFDLYCKLLEESVQTLHKRPITKARPPLVLGPDIKALIPDTYITSPRERLAIYQRVTEMGERWQIDDLLQELGDRYGDPPKLVQMLMKAVRAQLADEVV